MAGEVRTASHLPYPLYSASAVQADGAVYLFGGYVNCGGHEVSGYSDRILRYDPTSHTVTTMQARLPSARMRTSAIWDGTDVYIFGGSSPGGWLRDIVRYNPAADTATLLDTTLPERLADTAAVWTGESAYIFGGVGDSWSDKIRRFDPVEGTVETIATTFPGWRLGMSAFWNGDAAYLLGGFSNGEREIRRFDPGDQALTLMNARLPHAVAGGSAVWNGAFGLLIGEGDEVMRFDPTSDRAILLKTRLPKPVSNKGAAVLGSSLIVFGVDGADESTCSDDDEVIEYSLAPEAPGDVAASSQPDGRHVNLSWASPVEDSHATVITGYKIYRGTASQSLDLVDEIGPANGYTDAGLQPATEYFYRVRATSIAGDGDLSIEQGVRTASPPGKPQDISAMSRPDAIELEWTGPINSGDSPITGYVIYRGRDSEQLGVAAELGTVLRYLDSDLTANTEYVYGVAARNAAGEGPISNLVKAVPIERPQAPANVTSAPGPGLGQITIEWTPPSSIGSGRLVGYRLYRGTNAGALAPHAYVGITPRFTDSNLTPGERYFYAVVTVAAGESSLSGQTCMRPSPWIAALGCNGVPL